MYPSTALVRVEISHSRPDKIAGKRSRHGNNVVIMKSIYFESQYLYDMSRL
jgi:hypothetical protein